MTTAEACRRYYASAHGQKIRRAYRQSARGKASATIATERYRKIDKGRAQIRRNSLKRRGDPQYAAWQKIYGWMRHYGLTLDQYHAMLEAQGELCAICRQMPKKHFHVDHDHKTGRVRGLLCDLCNLLLGQAQDNPEILRAAISYLQKSQCL